MIGWNGSPPELKDDLNRMMCTGETAIQTFKTWLSQPGYKKTLIVKLLRRYPAVKDFDSVNIRRRSLLRSESSKHS